MGVINLSQRFLVQPQYPAPLKAEYAKSAQIFAPFNEQTGRDIAAGNNLVPGNSPTLVTRPHGKALSFNGSSNYLISSAAITPGASFTVMAWVRAAATNSSYARIAETQYSDGFLLGTNSGSAYCFMVNPNSLDECSGGVQTVGQRDFICGVFDGANRILYVNSVQVGYASTAITAPTNAKTLYIATNFVASANFWNGDIDGVGVFNRAFSAAEINKIREPWDLLQAPARRIFITAAAAPGGSNMFSFNPPMRGGMRQGGGFFQG